MTGGSAVRDNDRCTLLACSGGADSSALVLALCSAVTRPAERFVVGHVLHDLRTAAEARADRDRAEALAALVHVPFVEARVRVRARRGNAEANARAARYDALARLARKARTPFVASAHHADDVLETLLINLCRGAGPAGMRGPAPVRELVLGVTLVRPMLSIDRAACEAICRDAGWAWAHDATNDDATRARAMLRERVLPALRAFWPRAARNASSFAALQRDIASDAPAADFGAPLDATDVQITIARSALRALSPARAGDVLRAARAALAGSAGAGSLAAVRVREAVAAARDAGTHTREFAWPGAHVVVAGEAVRVSPLIKPPRGPRAERPAPARGGARASRASRR